ncbi:hypothetical protein K9M74_00750 [Candidatus Woesearchaeota archaeon]|nr:hypothetical protein [Candidatus Woesearchaeota archaeon]
MATKLIITSIINLLIGALLNIISLETVFGMILIPLALISSILVIAFIFEDAAKRKLSKAYAALGLFVGGFGGLIYYFALAKDKPYVKSNPDEDKAERNKSRTSAAYFNLVMGIIMLIALIPAIPWKGGYINWGAVGPMLGLTLIFFTIFFALKPAKQK